MLEKHTAYVCYNFPTCPHIHDEIDTTCRYVGRSMESGAVACKQVFGKNRQCGAGHDFEEARGVSLGIILVAPTGRKRIGGRETGTARTVMVSVHLGCDRMTFLSTADSKAGEEMMRCRKVERGLRCATYLIDAQWT
jgi:hypothetical protein